MSQRHITQPRDRKSQRYLDTHERLLLEILPQKLGPTKQDRKTARSKRFRQNGGE